MRKNYRGYTRFNKQKVQSFFDIQTSALSPTVLKFNAGGEEILRRLPGFFASHKYYKLAHLKITAVPQSTLPVDPTGLSYEAGENTVDPRDQLTPGLIRITNGEDMRGFSANFSRSEYNSMMLDPRWYKFMLQTGFKRSVTPRFWGVGTLKQAAWPGQVVNEAFITDLGELSTAHTEITVSDGVIEGQQDLSYRMDAYDGSYPTSLFQSGQRVSMGWIPTDAYENIPGTGLKGFVNTPPEIPCVTVVLPQAYKTVYYYRVFITETVLFKDPVVQDDFFNPVDYQLSPCISTDLHVNSLEDAEQSHNSGVQ